MPRRAIGARKNRRRADARSQVSEKRKIEHDCEVTPIPPSKDGKIKATMSLRAVGGRKCLSAHCLWHCSAPYEAARCRSNRESIQNQRSERHRSQCSVLLRVLGRVCGHDGMGGCCRTNG